MNANEAATERSNLFQKLDKAKEALGETVNSVMARCNVIREECTHLREDGSSAILTQSEGLFEYCHGCGKEF